MKKKKMKSGNVVLKGMIVGTAVGMVMSGVTNAKKYNIQKTVKKSLNAMGEAIQSVSEYMK